MTNMNVENLSKIVQGGNIDGMMGSPGVSVASEAKVAAEMRNNGMTPTGGADGVGFSDLFRKTVDSVNVDQVNANTAIKELVAGRNKNIHETMLAIEKADTSLKLMMQVRNKVLDAYREIMRMQV